jgi:hypothetical protein
MPAPAPLGGVKERVRATAMADSTSRRPGIDGFTLIETIDSVCAAILRGAGINDIAARAIMAALWDEPVHCTALDPPPRTPWRTDVESEFLRDVGLRVHVIRRARHRSSEDLCRVLSLRPLDLLDIEEGVATPTALLLYRLAMVLQVPVPMLVDPKATPLKVLRLLAPARS